MRKGNCPAGGLQPDYADKTDSDLTVRFFGGGGAVVEQSTPRWKKQLSGRGGGAPAEVGRAVMWRRSSEAARTTRSYQQDHLITITISITIIIIVVIIIIILLLFLLVLLLLLSSLLLLVSLYCSYYCGVADYCENREDWCLRLQPDKVLMDIQDDTAVEVMQLLSLDLSTTSLAVNVGWGVDQVERMTTH